MDIDIDSLGTYRCTGHCRRTGFTSRSVMRQKSKSTCPYCCGTLVNEKTGELPPEPQFPAFPDTAELERIWQEPEES